MLLNLPRWAFKLLLWVENKGGIDDDWCKHNRTKSAESTARYSSSFVFSPHSTVPSCLNGGNVFRWDPNGHNRDAYIIKQNCVFDNTKNRRLKEQCCEVRGSESLPGQTNPGLGQRISPPMGIPPYIHQPLSNTPALESLKSAPKNRAIF